LPDLRWKAHSPQTPYNHPKEGAEATANKIAEEYPNLSDRLPDPDDLDDDDRNPVTALILDALVDAGIVEL